MQSQVIFLGLIISSKGVAADPGKIRAIRESPETKTIYEVHSFHGLATFHRRFIKVLAPSWPPSQIV